MSVWNAKLTTVLKADRFDLEDWQKVSQGMPKLAAANAAASNDFGGQPVQDSFFALKTSSPQFADNTPTGLKPLAELIKRGMDTPAWGQLHKNSVGDLISAGVASYAFVTDVLKGLPQEVKDDARDAAQAQEQADSLNAQAQNLMETAELLAEMDKPEEAEQIKDKAAKLQAKAADKQAEAEYFSNDALEGIEQNGAKIAAIAQVAARNADKQAQEVSAMVRGFTLAAGGDPKNVDPSIAGKVAKVMQQNPNLKDLAEMLGWAKKTVRGEWRKSPSGTTAMVGYTVHELQPSKMATSEYMAMVSDNEAVALDWMRRVADNSISHRRYEGEEQQGRGEMVLIRDESGSMAGTSHALAVALEWALLDIARRDNREFISVPFSGFGQFETWKAPKTGKRDADSLVAYHLSHFYGGGTEPYRPIVEALRQIEAGDKRADILLITDGDFCQPGQEFLDVVKSARSKRPLKIVTVIIGPQWGDHEAKKFSDKVINVANFVRGREKLKAAIADIV